MRTRNGRNLVPEDGARFRGVGRSRQFWIAYTKTFDALRVQVYLAAVIPGEPLQQFRNRALGAMATVDKRRNNREPQVSESSGAQVELRERWPRTAPKVQWWEAGTADRAATRNTHSKGNL